MSLYRATSRAGLPGYISRAFRPVSDQPFPSLGCSARRLLSHNDPLPQNSRNASSDCLESHKSQVVSSESIWSSNLEKLNIKLACLKVKQNLSLPCSLSFQRSVNYGSANQTETGSTPRATDFVRGAMEEIGNSRFGGFQYPQNNIEENADILRITMLRNNTFVTLTDSKGQKKAGVCASAGTLPDKGGKDSRYSAEAAAEHVGREARKAGIKSIVVKISGFTHFKKKRQAIMAFKEGYTYGRGDKLPVVYIEDKTRLAHNGCRKPKKRRI